jgi:regulator of protease activity HflC (stomatin/prohibitin superfamily)
MYSRPKIRKTKKAFNLLTLSLVLLALNGGSSSNSIDQGEEAVLIYQPWFIGHGGVDKIPIKTGQVWTVFSTKVVHVNLKPYLIDEKFDDLITFDNNPVDFKFHFIFKNIAGKTPILVENFGTGESGRNWYYNNLREAVRNMARDYTKTKKVFEMTTNKQTVDKMQIIISKEVETLLKEKKIPVELVRVTVGKVYPPQKVIDATIATAVQKQNVKTQQERVKAEKARKEAEIASADADKAYADKFGMTPTQFLKLRSLENQRVAIDGASSGNIKLNMIIGGDVKPMLNISDR